MSAAESTAQPWLRVTAALLALTAGAVHLGQVSVHLEEGWPLAAFFLMVGVIQVGASALLLRPRPRSWFWFGIAGTATVIGIWGISRTVGLSIEEGGAVEPLGVADGFASLTETWTIIILGLYLAEPIRHGRLAAHGLSAALILGSAGLWLAAAQGGAFNADPARLAAAQPWLIDWLIAACGLALGGGVLLGGAGPISAAWHRGLMRGLLTVSVLASAGLVWTTLPPTIGQNLDCRYGALAAIQVGGHAAEPSRVLIGTGGSLILPIFELRLCGGVREVALEAVDPVTILGDGAAVDGFWLLPVGARLGTDGAEVLPSGAQPVPPDARLLADQPRQLVIRLVGTGAGDYLLGSVRLAYRAVAAAETFTFATTVAVCSGACPAD